MTRYLLVVPSKARAGEEEAYNEWYDKVHLADVVAVPGIVAGRRYDLHPDTPDTPDGNHLAIYEIEADDPASVIAELRRRGDSGEMAISSALDFASAKMWLYQPH